MLQIRLSNKEEDRNMEEKILIKGTQSTKWLHWIIIGIGLLPYIILIPQHEFGYFEADIFLVLGMVVIIAGIVMYFYSGKCSIIVSDKRVYGTAAFGTRVDLPFDMISAVGITGITHGIEVATASGKVKFMYVGNASEIHSVINEILMKRQDRNHFAKQELSGADELKKYKDLLNSGVITQEEFDAKKKQLLGL